MKTASGCCFWPRSLFEGKKYPRRSRLPALLITLDIIYSGTAQFTLVDSAGEEAGAGELGLLLYNGGTVCDDSFDNNAAEAICVELGFSGATRWNSDQTFSIQRNYDITLDDVRCDGETWTTCSFRNDHNCVHSEDIFLECS